MSTLLILLALAVFIPFSRPQAPVVVDNGPFLFDLHSDSTESTNVFTSDDYSQIANHMMERTEYWANQIADPQIPSTSGKNTSWIAAGGVAPWLESTYTPLNVKQGYFYEDAPNIVFVLVDDWGYNDVGYQSTYMSWTTPTIDRLAAEGVKLSNYYTHETCTPSRGALLTGRFAIRLGLWQSRDNSELPLNETTLAQEMKGAGYRTYMVGKWHLGYSTTNHLPSQRGFDSYYGYYSGFVDYWNKTCENGFLDLQQDLSLVTDEDEISSSMHNGYLMQSKAEAAIANHAANYASQPMFLYYAMQLIHGVWSAPDTFLERCPYPTSVDDDYVQDVEYNYCALNLMLDEAIANLTCAIEAAGMSENTLLVIASDNGGEATVLGNSVPWKGHKGSYYRGGVSANAFIHGKLVPESMQGQSYSGQMHVADWLPTLMNVATNSDWDGMLLSGAEMDGKDMWEAITSNSTSPNAEILFYVDTEGASALQWEMYKYLNGTTDTPADEPDFYFDDGDQAPENAAESCIDPSLVHSSYTVFTSASAFDLTSLSSRTRVDLTVTALLVCSALLIIFVTRYRFYAESRIVQEHEHLKREMMFAAGGFARVSTTASAAPSSPLSEYGLEEEQEGFEDEAPVRRSSPRDIYIKSSSSSSHSGNAKKASSTNKIASYGTNSR